MYKVGGGVAPPWTSQRPLQLPATYVGVGERPKRKGLPCWGDDSPAHRCQLCFGGRRPSRQLRFSSDKAVAFPCCKINLYLIPPKTLESRRCQLSVAHCVLDRLVSQIGLDRARIDALIGQLVAETNEYQSVDDTEGEFFWSSPPQDVYLLPQRPNLCLKRCPRPEQIDNRPINKSAIPSSHNRIA